MSPHPDPMPSAARLARRLEDWYRACSRDLPWRRHADPYAIWVSEVMLQQTRVQTVRPYYLRWMARFPDVGALASAPEDAVLRLWEGLGYYSRARRLHAGARVVLARHGGELPRTAAGLLELPGVGPYTAGAVASLAFGERVAAVDGNVVRVVARLRGIDATGAALAAAVHTVASALVRAARAPDALNQALMELGATLCTPRGPRCGECPARSGCVARASGRTAELPRPAARPAPILVHAVAALARRGSRVLVGRLGADAPRWAGLWTFPTAEVRPNEAPATAVERAALACGARVAGVRRVASLEHTVTRHRVTLDAFECRPVGCTGRAAPPWVTRRWVPSAALGELALPAPHRRLARAALRGDGGGALTRG
ncbi:MAG: A/G-specific adenine glycosylase [Polyangiaceae bacterium]|nr:A/G-specific adenine glycosylase [Polyangiaceae bacterium]